MVSIATGNPLGDGDWVFAGWRRAALDKDGKPTGQVFDYLVKDINPGDPFPFPGFRVEESSVTFTALWTRNIKITYQLGTDD